jgi:DNA polymerase III alpha subunit
VKIDQYGRVTITEEEAFKALYTNQVKTLDGVMLGNAFSIEQYNQARAQNADRIPELKELEIFEDSVEFFDQSNQCNWFMPDDYYPNLVEMLYGMCETNEQKDRVTQELTLFIQHGMFDLLFYLKYLVDTMRENKIVWGVGRGSSVASYVLYLLGVHKIDSLKYNLDIKEFLKENQNEL